MRWLICNAWTQYQHTGLATTEALIRARPDLVRNVMKAYVEGIHYYKTAVPALGNSRKVSQDP